MIRERLDPPRASAAPHRQSNVPIPCPDRAPRWRALALLALVLALAGCVSDAVPAPVAAARAAARARSAAPVLIVGHRGASGLAPEHTIAAYDLARSLGADYIEQDLQLTRDGVLVVLHDPTLDRTARGPAEHCTGRVIDRTLAELRTCDVGSWFNAAFPDRARAEYVGLRIPTLDEVFARYGHSVDYYIETKNPEDAPGMEEALLALMDRHGLRPTAAAQRAVLIQSFSAASLKRLHALDPSLPLIQLGGSSSRGVRATLDEVARYAVGIGPKQQIVDAALVRAAHARCLDVHPYTVDAEADMQRLIALGVDGMFTDVPDRLDALLGRPAAERRQAAQRSADAGAACRAAR